MASSNIIQLQRWQRRHPDFDWQDYQNWIRRHGYYRNALDVSKPEFSEYATIYLQQQRRAVPASRSLRAAQPRWS